MLWGLDIGGTKLEGVVLADASPEAVVARLRIDTEAERGYQHIVSRVKLLLKLLIEKAGERPETIGVGHPGTTECGSGQVKNSNTTVLNGRRFIEDLQQELRVPIAAANDANCFTLAETTFGAAQGCSSVFGIIMGTGVGGGICIDGRVLAGRNGIAGEWGHNVLDPTGPECYCGKNGCVETFISGPALETYYSTLSGRSLPLAKIIAESNHDEAAEQTAARLYEYFGKALAMVINILDPDCIIIGGGVSNVPGLYSFGREAAREHVFSEAFETPLLKHSLGDSGGVFGAALLSNRRSRK